MFIKTPAVYQKRGYFPNIYFHSLKKSRNLRTGPHSIGMTHALVGQDKQDREEVMSVNIIC